MLTNTSRKYFKKSYETSIFTNTFTTHKKIRLYFYPHKTCQEYFLNYKESYFETYKIHTWHFRILKWFTIYFQTCNTRINVTKTIRFSFQGYFWSIPVCPSLKGVSMKHFIVLGDIFKTYFKRYCATEVIQT